MPEFTPPLEAVTRRLAEIRPELTRLTGLGKLTAQQNDRWRELATESDELMERQEQLLIRRESQAAAADAFPDALPTSRLVTSEERTRPPSGDECRDAALRSVEASPYLSHASKGRAVDVIEAARQDPAATGVTKYASLASDDLYCRAFSKLMRHPLDAQLHMTAEEQRRFADVNEEYRAMTAGTGNTGGYMVPLYMDPSFVVTGAGARNPFRDISNVKTCTTLTYNGSTAGQVSAGLLGENAAFSDNAPTVAQVQLPTYKYGCYIPASFEAFEDIDALAQDVGDLFADAKLNLEATQFATGSGSAPHGVVTDVTANAPSRVSPTTGGTFVLADLYKVHAALSPRYRNSDPAKRAWAMSVNMIDTIRQFATANNYNAFLTDLSGGQPPRLLGDQLVEASAMSTSITTGQNVMLFGDFSRFLIIDRVGLTTEFIPNVFDQATGRPSGTRAWLMHWRFASGCSDPAGLKVLLL